MILINCLWSLFSTSPVFIQVSTDRSYPEFYQYTKEFWIVYLLFAIYIKTREVGYLGWASLFFYMLLDDSIEIHERLGEVFAKHFDFNRLSGLRPQDFGELITTALFASVLFTIIGIFYRYGSNTFKKVSIEILTLVIMIVFFGIFIDMVHITIQLGKAVDFLLSIIEDGGEMIAMSITVSYFFNLKLNYFNSNK